MDIHSLFGESQFDINPTAVEEEPKAALPVENSGSSNSISNLNRLDAIKLILKHKMDSQQLHQVVDEIKKILES